MVATLTPLSSRSGTKQEVVLALLEPKGILHAAQQNPARLARVWEKVAEEVETEN
jgi:hypothetical protein